MKHKINIKSLIIGLVIGLTLSISTVYGITQSILASKDVTYDNNTSKGASTDVQGSLDELYRLTGVLSEEWKDSELKGNDPVLAKGLIPVVIEDNGDVYYANQHTEWYNYSEKRWANAVMLVEHPENPSNPNNPYTPGDKIDESDIRSYFVWIPRFKYQLWNVDNYGLIEGSSLEDTSYDNSAGKVYGNARLIKIEFETGEVTKASANPQNGDWITHPAFIRGDEVFSGIWVGKFETGYNQDNDKGNPIKNIGTTNGANQNSNASNRIIVKPNVYSWRNNPVYNMFMAAYNYERDNLDSHMMKNTEWGAVAYLSHSIYGIGREVSVNNNSTNLTGYGTAAGIVQNTHPGKSGTGKEETGKEVTFPYNTSTGDLASTTGNITGVYDMSGGAYEYMAAFRKNGTIEASKFPENELSNYIKNGYIDEYPESSEVTTYNNRILGDATGEMGPFYNYKDSDNNQRYHNSWYADVSNFVGATKPWFHRGGTYYDGVLAGQFDFSSYTGGTDSGFSSRLVLSPK